MKNRLDRLTRFRGLSLVRETRRFNRLTLIITTLYNSILYLLNLIIINIKKDKSDSNHHEPYRLTSQDNPAETPETPETILNLKPNTKGKTMKNSTKTILDKHEKAIHDTTAMIRLARLSNAIAFSMQIQSDANHIPVKGIKVLLKSC